jgi:hypothetical protein
VPETILIVEDEPEFAALVELWMGRAGLTAKLERLTAGGTSAPLGEQLHRAERGPVFDPVATH